MKIPSASKIKELRAPETVPAGWFTRQEIQKEWGYGQDYTNRLLGIAIRNGRAEVRKFRIHTGRGFFPTPHYRFKG